MCLNQLVQVVSVDGRGCADGVVDGRAESRVVRLSLVVLELEGVPVEPGDWLVSHTGVAIERLAIEDAERILAAREELSGGGT
ncbi:MAG: HypC/HybG/HupF family hydrogenase formation chaperone [Acidimicrobiales bacterium]|nr:HypC/HybG/HupF family hydrogenase formation chaperone [Acidimicrobiales bacterium]